MIDVDGELTDIDEVEGLSYKPQATDVYTLSGVKIKSGVSLTDPLKDLEKGVYIVNGKKFIK